MTKRGWLSIAIGATLLPVVAIGGLTLQYRPTVEYVYADDPAAVTWMLGESFAVLVVVAGFVAWIAKRRGRPG